MKDKPQDISKPLGAPGARWWSLLLVVAAFLLSRGYLLAVFNPIFAEVNIYFDFAVNGVDLGVIPYEEIPLEFPPAAYWLMTVPRWLDADRLSRQEVVRGDFVDQWHHYARWYRAMMFAFDLGAFLLLAATLHRRRPELLTFGLWGYVLAGVGLGHLLYERLDAGLVFLFMVWAYAWVRSGEAIRRSWLWATAAYLGIGLGIAYKFMPLVMAPFLLWADVQTVRRRGDWRWAGTWIVLAAAALLPFMWAYLQAGSGLATLFQYHRLRGIQLESLYASLMILLAPLGPKLQVFHGHGSYNVTGDLGAPMLWLSSALPLVVLGGLGLWALVRGRRFDRLAAYRTACLAMVAAVIVAKVFSPQYLIWAWPLMLLLGAELLSRRQFIALLSLILLATALTTWIFPYHYHNPSPFVAEGDETAARAYPLLSDLHWLPCTAVVLRNALYLGMVVWLAARWTGGKEPPTD